MAEEPVVNQTRDENALHERIAAVQVSRSGRPTSADADVADDPPNIVESEDVSEDQTPQALAKLQADIMEAELKEERKHHKSLEELITPFGNRIENPIARTGNPLESFANHIRGDRVHDLLSNGKFVLKIQTNDKSHAFAHYGENPDDIDVVKSKVLVSFPAINPDVSQREFNVQVEDNPCGVMFLSPDTSSINLLLPRGALVHIEVAHMDKDGKRGYPYLMDFKVGGTVYHPSPITCEVMEDVVVKVPKQVVEEEKHLLKESTKRKESLLKEREETSRKMMQQSMEHTAKLEKAQEKEAAKAEKEGK